jgi:BA14K-like protein
MTRLGVLGATALSLSFAIASPVLAQQQQGHGGRAHVGAHATGGNMGGGQRMQPNMGAQANVARGNANFAARGNGQFARGNPQFAGRGEFRGDRGRGYGRDAGFAVGAAAAGVATGAAIAAGGYGYGYRYGYDPSYYGDNYAYDPGYGDSYAYDNGVTYNTGIPLVTFDQQAPVEGPVAVAGDASYCAQRYRSYDPASGTYLGFDGMRHPCP